MVVDNINASSYMPTGIADPSNMLWTIGIIMTMIFVFAFIWFIYNWITE